MLKEFKDFILKGNAIDLSVGILIGAAFGSVVKAFTDGIINPLLNAIGGKPDVSLHVWIFDVGTVLNACISLIITGAVLFFIFIKPMNHLKAIAAKQAAAAPPAPAEPSAQEKLLEEIRDLLKNKASGIPKKLCKRVRGFGFGAAFVLSGQGVLACGMTVVKSFRTLADAHLAKSVLEAAGLEADILDEYVAGNAPHLLGPSGVRLSVADEDAPHARVVLGLPPQDAPPPRRSSYAPVWAALVVAAAGLSILISGIRSNHPADTFARETDRNHDGKADYRVEYDSDGVPQYCLEDNNFDGLWDVRTEFKDGIVSKVESDPDFNGSYDVSVEYQSGVPVSKSVRPGGNGEEISRTEYVNGVVSKIWLDNDRDGRWDERIDYDPLGRETARVKLH